MTSPARVRNSDPAHADVIVEVEPLQQRVSVAQLVAPQVDLDPARAVLQVQEGRLPLRPHRGDPAGDRDAGPVFAHRVVVGGERFGSGMGALVAVGERGDPRRLQRRTLLAPCRLDERALLIALVAPAPAHAALPPNRLRYAWMNPSRSPSMTRCTSPTFTSVRWSLTMV